jgi:hypothetical protein
MVLKSGLLNENLMQYETELKGSIIISVDNQSGETVSKLLNNKDENQSIRIELINKNGEIFRIII